MYDNNTLHNKANTANTVNTANTANSKQYTEKTQLATQCQKEIVRLHISNAVHVIQHKITIHCETKTHKQKVIVRLHINNAVHVIQQYKKPLRKHSCIKLHQMSPLPLHFPTPYSRTSRNRWWQWFKIKIHKEEMSSPIAHRSEGSPLSCLKTIEEKTWTQRSFRVWVICIWKRFPWKIVSY